MSNSIVLKYIGDGGFIPDPPVPARDLTDEDILASGLTREQLIGSGLYLLAAETWKSKREIKGDAPRATAPATKEGE
jgi:hypothetical protein